MSIFDLRRYPKHRRLGSHPAVYEFGRHLRQFFKTPQMRYAQWAFERYARSMFLLAIPSLFVVCLGTLPAIAKMIELDFLSAPKHEHSRSLPALPRPMTAKVSAPRRRKKGEKRPGLTVSMAGAILIASLVTGLRTEGQRAFYENARPTFSPSATHYVDLDAVSNGNGTEGSPWNTLSTTRIRFPQAGDRFEMWGTYDATDAVDWAYGLLIQGSPAGMVQYRVRPGYACEIDHSAGGGYACIGASSMSNCWFDGFELRNLPGYTVDLRFGSNNVLTNLTCYGAKIEGSRAVADDWVEQVFVDLEIDEVLESDDNAGDCITFNEQSSWPTGAAPGSGHIIYDCTFRRPGHIAVVLAGGGPQDKWIQSSRVAFCDVSAPVCAGVVIGKATDCIAECNYIHDVGTDITSVALSKEALQISGLRCIGRFNRIKGFGPQGIFVYLGAYESQSQDNIDCEIHHNSLTDGLGLPLFINARDLISTAEFRGTKIYNNLAWDYHKHTLGGDNTQNYNHGYYEGDWYDIIIQAPSSNPTSPAYIEWIGGGDRTIGSNEIKNNMFGSNRHEGDRRYMLYVSGILFNAGYADEAAALADAMTSATLAGHVQDQDPLFVSTDPTSPSFLMISSSSPAKNAGKIISGLSYAGSAPDIGVHEVG